MKHITQEAVKGFLEQDVHGMLGLQRFAIRTLQIAIAVIRDLTDRYFSLHAMSLVYTTLITLVPLLAISFSVLKGFGAHNQIEPFLLNLLQDLGPDKSSEITARVIGFVDNIKVGVLGAAGLALLIYSVIALMQKIEVSFNYIWRVAEDRSLTKRFSDYLSVLLMGPLLIFISAGVTTAIRNLPVVDAVLLNLDVGPVYFVAALVFPWLIMALGFTFIYVYMPNTKVRISAAFAGALVAALLWKVMGYLFSSFIAGSANYIAIYAAFATLIVFMIWLYASWFIMLLGANVSFYVQYPRYIPVSRAMLDLTPHMTLMIGLSVMYAVTRNYQKGDGGCSLEALSRSLNIPILAVQKVVTTLEDGGMLTVTLHKDKAVRFIPAVAPGTTPLQKLVDVLEKHGGGEWKEKGRIHYPSEILSLAKAMDESRQTAFSDRSVAAAFNL